MKITAHFQPSWPTSAPPRSHPPEQCDPARIEASMLALARAAARAGGRVATSNNAFTSKVARSYIEGLLNDPVAYALMQAEADLFIHCTKVAGGDIARAANRRINAALYEEFERPVIEAEGPRQ